MILGGSTRYDSWKSLSDTKSLCMFNNGFVKSFFLFIYLFIFSKATLGRQSSCSRYFIEDSADGLYMPKDASVKSSDSWSPPAHFLSIDIALPYWCAICQNLEQQWQNHQPRGWDRVPQTADSRMLDITVNIVNTFPGDLGRESEGSHWHVWKVTFLLSFNMV